jgi:hypothetical protein
MWISMVLSGLIFLLLGIKLKWFNIDLLVLSLGLYLIATMTCLTAFSSIPVQTQVNSIKVFLNHTASDTIATDNGHVICVLPKSTGTNGFVYIKHYKKINFLEVTLQSTYSY